MGRNLIFGYQGTENNDGRRTRMSYYIGKEEDSPRALSIGVASLVDNHYVLWDQWGGYDSVDSLWADHIPEIFGVEHDPEVADNKLRQRMLRRAKKLAKRTSRDLIDCTRYPWAEDSGEREGSD